MRTLDRRAVATQSMVGRLLCEWVATPRGDYLTYTHSQGAVRVVVTMVGGDAGRVRVSRFDGATGRCLPFGDVEHPSITELAAMIETAVA